MKINCKSVCFVSVTCASLTLVNGDVSYSTSSIDRSYPVGTTASFTCGDGYRRYGSGSNFCQTTGEWTGELPTCGGNKARTLLLKRNWKENFFERHQENKYLLTPLKVW